jgi:hypothetical protein
MIWLLPALSFICYSAHLLGKGKAVVGLPPDFLWSFVAFASKEKQP